MRAEYDVVVVGAGHAGIEAANAAARLGVRVLLLTLNLENIGQMSCNPAIGGIAKGTVVREVDAMGGLMGRAADRATIQFRMLNQSKGPAVWAPRAQCDRGLYRRAVRELLERQEEVHIRHGTVATLALNGSRTVGVVTGDGERIDGRTVVLAAGTFLKGRMFVGLDNCSVGGRAGDPSADELAGQMASIGLEVDRFKTGTPPRIDGRSVDYVRLEKQLGGMPSFRFSHYEWCARPEQRPCWVTWAGDEVKKIIGERIEESALYGGVIGGMGPRYCPSIEDKILRFPDAERHQVFLEPEGLDTAELYVNGLSTSLPVDVQLQFLQAVPGLENVRMTRSGYAIEYDYYPPRQLKRSMESKAIDGLFFAGQVNGTTGYEEAGAQGMVAGINAARTVKGEGAVFLGREDAYIGVLLDDLVTRGVDEPYRLFTSRAEYRLLLRQDNALLRLGGVGADLGMLADDERQRMEQNLAAKERIEMLARETVAQPSAVNETLRQVGERELDEAQRVADLVRRPKLRLKPLLESTSEDLPEVGEDAWTSAEVELKYSGYLERERRTVERVRDMSTFALPVTLDYSKIDSLRIEARQKLQQVKPETLAQAGRIPGVSPSDLQNLVVEVLKMEKLA